MSSMTTAYPPLVLEVFTDPSVYMFPVNCALLDVKRSANIGKECASCFKADNRAFSGVSGSTNLGGISAIKGGSDGGSG